MSVENFYKLLVLHSRYNVVSLVGGSLAEVFAGMVLCDMQFKLLREPFDHRCRVRNSCFTLGHVFAAR